MQIYNINPNLIAFYFEGDAAPGGPIPAEQMEGNWATGVCDSLGVASYAIYSGAEAIIYDTLCSPQQANEIKSYLEGALSIGKFTVVLSHWHLDHVGGNELYREFNIVACRKTREHLLRQKAEIEAGTLWGEPAINPLRLPDIVFDDALSIYVGDLEVALYNYNIHSDDSVCAYIPKYKILLPGDMLEETIPFVTNPEDMPTHLKNYDLLRAMDIEKILPNHGRSRVIKNGGYSKGLIESVAHYLSALHAQLNADPDGAVPDLRQLMAEYLDKGVVHYWEPYAAVHKINVQRVRDFLKNQR